MSMDVCRLCNTQSTKLTASINDEIVSKFIESIPSLNLSSSLKFPSKVCQLCYGKAKISCDFIDKIQNAQKQIEKTFKKSPRKNFTNSNPVELQDALRKVQKVGIKITKVQPKTEIEYLNESNDSMFETPFMDHHDEDFKNEPEDELDDGDVEVLSDEDYVEEVASNGSSDDDEDYKPNRSGAKGGGRKSGDKGSSKATASKRIKSDDVREIIIDAPISFTCSKCSNKFPDLETLTTHMKARTCFTPETPSCKICGKTFGNRKNLSNHMSIHRQRDKIICEVCAKAFNHNYDLQSHMESVHRRVVRRDCIYKCTHCAENFNSQMDLLDHVKEHQREKKEAPRMCEFCGRECKNLKAYQNHLLTHKETKPHNCEVCGKGFTKHFLLVQHMHIHTGIKAYTCDICSKSYAKRDSLRIHKKRDHPNYIMP